MPHPGDPHPREANLDATSREAIELALDAGRMGVFSWDARNDVVVWDARLETLFGISSGSFGGTYADWLASLHPADRDLATSTVQRAMRTGGSFDFEHRVVHPDGSVRWLEGRGRAIVVDGEVLGVRGVTVDITARKRVELELASAQRRLRVLVRAGVALGSALDIDVVLARLSAVLVPDVADAFEVALLLPSGELQRVAVVGPEEGWAARRLGSSVPLIADHPFARAIRGAAPVHARADEQPDQFGPVDVPTTAAAAGLRDVIVVPLFEGPRADQRRVVGVLSLAHTGHRRAFDDDDVPFVAELGARVAVAVERCHSFERERLVAERLQDVLLPDAVPSVEGLDIAVRYRPSAAGVQVGGDWYDVVESSTGVWISVGDVVGHGVEAAAIMGRARAMLQALTVDERLPERALTRLDAAVMAIPDEPFVTVVLARIDIDTGAVELALAGHPPALLVGPSGTVQRVGRPQPPVGATNGHRYVGDHVDAGPGALLLFFTDGLVERRDEIIDAGLDRLAAAASTWAGHQDVEAIADDLLERLRADDSDDDLALVVVRLR